MQTTHAVEISLTNTYHNASHTEHDVCAQGARLRACPTQAGRSDATFDCFDQGLLALLPALEITRLDQPAAQLPLNKRAHEMGRLTKS
jgi:hypothetical protein